MYREGAGGFVVKSAADGVKCKVWARQIFPRVSKILRAYLRSNDSVFEVHL